MKPNLYNARRKGLSDIEITTMEYLYSDLTR